MSTPTPTVDQFAYVSSIVGDLVTNIRSDQWELSTLCDDWNVRDLVIHLVSMNKLFTALLDDQPPPEHTADPLHGDPAAAYRTSAEALQTVFSRPGILERIYQGPFGSASGATRLHWRITDLLVHAWDLARAVGRPIELPEELADHALTFVRNELASQPRAGRFDPDQPIADNASAADRLAAYLGRHA